MTSTSFISLRSNPELQSLYEVSHLPTQTHLQDYFLEVMTILSRHFSVNYSALLLQYPQKGSLSVEALFGFEKELHPLVAHHRKGVISEVLQSRQCMAIQNLNQEPLYEEVIKGSKQTEQINLPLLCIPLLAEGDLIGVMNINPIYGSRSDFAEDFHFLSVLSAILAPMVKKYYFKKEESLARTSRAKLKTSLLEEVLEERLTEVLNKIDPYVELKNRTGLLDDIVSLVEKILIKLAMEKMNHVQTTAAQLLGINRNTLRTKMREMKIKPR